MDLYQGTISKEHIHWTDKGEKMGIITDSQFGQTYSQERMVVLDFSNLFASENGSKMDIDIILPIIFTHLITWTTQSVGQFLL